MNNATIAMWFSSFRENPLVFLLKRRIDIRMVRLCRSTKHVRICS